MKISVVISAYNEEKMLEDCLLSVKGFADEIIVVDNSSTDKTSAIAKKFTNKIFKVPNDPVMLNKNKNFGFAKASGDWILSLDADERLTKELSREILLAVKNKEYQAYEFPRKNIIFGKWIKHSIWWPDYNLRFFEKGKGKFPLKHVHEKLKVSGKIGKLESPLEHQNYQSVHQFIEKLNNTYTESEAQHFMESGNKIYWYDAIKWPVNDFVKTFFFQKGYKDGFHGLMLSIFQAFYSFVFFAKVWEKKESFKDIAPENFLIEVIKQLQLAAKDIRFWIYESLMSENPSKKLLYKIKRKLK